MNALHGRRVLVSGGCGFIGSHLVARLLRDGARVVVLDRVAPPPSRPLGAADGRLDFVRHRLGSDPRAELDAALDGIELVFHLAAEKHRPSLDAPDDLLATNIVGTRLLFDCAARRGVKKVVFASSLFAYGRLHGPPMDERECPTPTTLYGISKLCGEQLLRLHTADGGMAGDVLRYFFVYGPGQYAGTGYKSVIVKTFERLAADAPPVINGDGLQALDYVFIDDAVEATVRCMAAPGGGRLLNVASGRATRVRDLIAAIGAAARSTSQPQTAPPDWTHGSCRAGTIDRIREALGWTPAVGLDEGLRRTWNAMGAARP